MTVPVPVRPSITAHVVVRNDERFVSYAVRSVIDHVDKVLIADTGSTDGTPGVLERLWERYGSKIEIEATGPCDKLRHTQVRQRMIECTTTDWFMILDGDEVWSERAIREAHSAIAARPDLRFIAAPYYNCVGDIFHDYVRRGSFQVLDRRERLTIRFARKTPGLCWRGAYGNDLLVDGGGETAFQSANTTVLQNRFWHLTHLERSSDDRAVYSSGGSRPNKRRPTWLVIGRRIRESPPEIFDQAFLRSNRVSLPRALWNWFPLAAALFRRGSLPGALT